MLFCTIFAAMAPLILAKPFDAEEVMTMLETLQVLTTTVSELEATAC